MVCCLHIMTDLPFPYQFKYILFFFYGLISMARTSNTILNRSGESGHSCALDFRGKAINFSPSSIMLAVGLS